MKYRIAGRTSKRFQINPTPAAFRITNSFLVIDPQLGWLPADWVTATTYVAGQYVSNTDGNIYYSATAGTSGATEPTHTSGTASDGSVQWTYFSGEYERPLADTDTSLLDEDLLEQDVLWIFRKLNGYDYQNFQAEAEMAWAQHFAGLVGRQL